MILWRKYLVTTVVRSMFYCKTTITLWSADLEQIEARRCVKSSTTLNRSNNNTTIALSYQKSIKNDEQLKAAIKVLQDKTLLKLFHPEWSTVQISPKSLVIPKEMKTEIVRKTSSIGHFEEETCSI
ncbi:hypothetical protein EVAR_34106_1 [Eumeta japonica]|uniref:Uncharacterized protein n=1 Tax=Eumeta variegata TaxID=151549 RepID=A0A4C1WKE3_EUMVA|nr:hypothetical protein EVAR_34106_1 [Eumeta japonica]